MIISPSTNKSFPFGEINISFSGGADCFNVSKLIACGFKPVTVCSDLLKPGGYGRLSQYLIELEKKFSEKKAESIDDFILKKASVFQTELHNAALDQLNNYYEHLVNNPASEKNSEKPG